MRNVLVCCSVLVLGLVAIGAAASAQNSGSSAKAVVSPHPSRSVHELLKNYPGVIDARLFEDRLRVHISESFAQSLTEESFDDWQSGLFGIFFVQDIPISTISTVVGPAGSHVQSIERWIPRRRLPTHLLAAGGGLACTQSGLNKVMRYPLSLPYGGALDGKTIILSPGHGLMRKADSSWGFQRGMVKFDGCGNCAGIIEDLSNAQIVNRYLIPVLLRAGARVYTPREWDDNTAEIIVDNGTSGYQETGDSWTAGTSAGGYLDHYRVLPPGSKGAAQFTPELPSEGWYWISTRYVAGANRSTATRFVIRHAGGTNTLIVDQRADGGRWIYLGQFWMRPQAGHGVRIEPTEGDPGHLIADAVRFGGGMHSSSNHPRWQMSAQAHLPYLGAPSSTYSGGDVGARPLYAEWQGADVYLSVHSNATGSAGTVSGTSTYRYNCGTLPEHTTPPDHSTCDDPAGSKQLHRFIHETFVHTLRDRWDPNWRDFKMKTANFGELRNLDKIPGVLIEMAFHDNVAPVGGNKPPKMADNRALQEPRWRKTAAFAMYHGLLKFLNASGKVIPETPQIESVTTQSSGSSVRVKASWKATSGAKGYRVYVAKGARGFDGNVVVEQTEAILDATPGEPVYVRVAALNEGGESLPSEVLGACSQAGRADERQVMIVQGFDREDAWTGENGNHFDYIFEHGEALASTGWGFHSATNEAVTRNAIELQSYTMVDWLLGEESTEDHTFDDKERQIVQKYLRGGGKLFATGAEIGYELVEKTVAPQFLTELFGARYESDVSDNTDIQVSDTAVFGTLPAMRLDDGTQGTYRAEYPDVYASAANGAVIALSYGNGKGAAIAFDNGSTRTVLTGFPLEAVQPKSSRHALTAAIVNYLVPDGPPKPIDPPDPKQPDSGAQDSAIEDVSHQRDDGSSADGGRNRADTAKADSDNDWINIPENNESSGCSCSAALSNNSFAPWLAGLVISVLAYRRRQRARS